jgi:hypothetical protein
MEGQTKTQPVPAVVRCSEPRQDVAPPEDLVYEHPQRYLGGPVVSNVSEVLALRFWRSLLQKY